METTTLVEEQIDAGNRLLRHLQANGIAVDVALWALASDSSKWWLYIASPLGDTDGIAATYSRVNKELSRTQENWVLRSDIKLIGRDHPVAVDGAKYRAAILSTHVGPWFGGRKLGDLIVEEAYVYPGLD